MSASRRFRIAGASLALRPAEWVEVHIGASALPAIDRAARLADGWIASPGLTCEEVRAQADFYRQRCAVYGREPGAIVLRRDIYVGESSNEAQAVLQQALSRGYRNLTVAKRGRSCRLYPPLCILGQPTPVNVVFGATIHADDAAVMVVMRQGPLAGAPHNMRMVRSRVRTRMSAKAPLCSPSAE